MSHELRTPINATLGYLDLIDLGVGGDVSEQHRDYLGRVRASQQHLLRIVTDLLNYSKIEAGQVAYQMEDVPAGAVVETVLPMVTPQAVSKGLRLEAGTRADDLIVRADRMRAEQIVLNLLSNAVKFTRTGGRVGVSYEVSDGMVGISVEDTGPGIPADKQAAIFEPFVQLGRSLSSGHEGTGLGLAISRDLARAMGGDVTVDSVLGEGSRFTLLLPRA